MRGFLADHNLPSAIINGVMRRRSIPFLRAVDVGMHRAEDDDLLAWAASRELVIVTYDVSTMESIALARIGDQLAMSGLLLVGRGMAIGATIEELVFLFDTATDDDWNGRIHHLPL